MSAQIYGKSAPRLLQDLHEYKIEGDYWRLFDPASDSSRCSHVFIKNSDRSNLPTLEDEKPKKDSKWAIALTCQNCRIHLDVSIVFDQGQATCPSSREAPLHHFCFDSSQAGAESQAHRHYEFKCSYEFCKACLGVTVRPPVIKPDELSYLGTKAKIRMQALPGRPRDPHEVLSMYIIGALQGKGKRIPAGNAVFQACLGPDMSDLLTRVGFTYERGTPGGDNQGWEPPKVPLHDKRSLVFDKQRRILEDAREELNLNIAKTSSAIFLPPPSKRDLEHIMGCLQCTLLLFSFCSRRPSVGVDDSIHRRLQLCLLLVAGFLHILLICEHSRNNTAC